MSRTTRKHFIKKLMKNNLLKRYEAAAIYDLFIAVLMEEILEGNSVLLTNFGRFDPKIYKGHKASFKEKKNQDEYVVVKFNTAATFKKKLREQDELIDSLKLPVGAVPPDFDIKGI